MDAVNGCPDVCSGQSRDAEIREQAELLAQVDVPVLIV